METVAGASDAWRPLQALGPSSTHPSSKADKAILLLLDDEAFHVSFFTPAREHLVKTHRTVRVLRLKKAFTLLFALAVVVARRAEALIVGHEGLAGNPFNPLSLAFARGLHCLGFARRYLCGDVGDMGGLPFQHVGEVRRKTGLRETHVEQIRKAVAQEAVVGLHPL